MTTDLNDRLAELAAAWETAAPPVAMAEIWGRTIDPAWSAAAGSVAAISVAPVRPGRRRSWPLVAAAVAIAAALVALVAVVVSDSGRHTLAPAESSPDTALPTSMVTAVPSTSESVPVPVLTIPVQSQIAEVARRATERLAQLHSFRATATVHTVQQGVADDPLSTAPTIENTSVNDVTVTADGSIWAEGEDSRWTSYDAASTVLRSQYLGPDGTAQCQEVVLGAPDLSTPLFILFGFDPVMHFDGLIQPTLSERTNQFGRAVWQITSTPTLADSTSSTSPETQTEAYEIDQQTGLVTAYERRSTSQGGTSVTTARLTDLVTDVELPAAFPGTFPDGAVVQRSGIPNETLPSLGEAASQFGAGLVVPTLGSDPSFLLVDGQLFIDGEPQHGVSRELSMSWHVGFARYEMVIRKSVLNPGAAAPPGWIVVDGLGCASPDGEHCAGFGGPSLITAGALVGVPTRVDGQVLIVDDGPIEILIYAAVPEDALAIANSLTTVES